MRAIIEKDAAGVYRILAQRAKFKHWFELGKHVETTSEFNRAYLNGTVEWVKQIKFKEGLF